MSAEFVDFVDAEFEENSEINCENDLKSHIAPTKINEQQKKLFKNFCKENDITLFTRNEKVNYVREKLRKYRKNCDRLLLKWSIHL